jgi:hypothetical protein
VFTVATEEYAEGSVNSKELAPLQMSCSSFDLIVLTSYDSTSIELGMFGRESINILAIGIPEFCKFVSKQLDGPGQLSEHDDFGRGQQRTQRYRSAHPTATN